MRECPARLECGLKVTQDYYETFCMTRAHKRCWYYIAHFAEKKLPREWEREAKE